MLNLRRSIFITFISTNISTIIQFGVTVILSRLLTPSEVGIFSVTAVLISIISVFRDFGVSSYLQQERNLTPEKARSAFGLLLTTSWLLAGFTYFSRGYIASYCNQPGIAEILTVLCISFTLVPFAAYFFAILNRNLQAGKQAYVNVFSSIAYAITCITLANLGFSYMALAWANVANISVCILIYLFIRPKEFSFVPKFSGWMVPIKFGSGAIAGNLLTNINLAIPDLVLGKISDMHSVGLYSRANGLVGIFQQVAGPTITYNTIPFLSKNHHDNVPLAPILSKATSYLTGVAWPAFIVTVIFAEEIIRFLYGAQWIAAAPIAGLIALQTMVRFGYSLNQSALLAIGRPYLSVFPSGASILARIGIVIAFGANDLMTFAIALCVADIATVVVPAFLMSKYMGFTLRHSIGAHWPSILLGFGCIVVTLLLKLIIPANWSDLLKLILVAVVLIPTWFTLMISIRHPLCQELPSILHKFFPVSFANKLINYINPAH